MMRRILPLGLGLMVLLLMNTIPAWGSPLTPTEKLEDFEYLYATVADNYPFLWVKNRLTGEDWLERKSEFRRRIAAAQTDTAFFIAMAKIVRSLQNDHTHLLDATAFEYYRKLYEDKPVWGEIFSADAQERYRSWASTLAQVPSPPIFYAPYIAGDYWVESVDASIAAVLPAGVKIIEVNGTPVDDYVRAQIDRVSLIKDWKRNKLYTRVLQIPARSEVRLGLEDSGKPWTITVPARLPGAAKGTGDAGLIANVTTTMLDEGQFAYVRVRRFAADQMPGDAAVIRRFLESAAGSPNLIIDIRGNGGGTDRYWENLLVGPLISKPLSIPQYLTVRSGRYVQKFVKAKIGLGYYFIRVPKQRLQNDNGLPDEVLSHWFADPISVVRRVSPKHPVAFSGRIFLLVDNGVYSSAESFAAFAKQTGWATLVGTRTGGDGIGFDPLFFTLPNSGLIVRMSQTMAINPDGTANDETKTVPDVFVEQDPHEHLVLQRHGAGPYPEYDKQLRAVFDLSTRQSVTQGQAGSPLGNWSLNPVLGNGYGFQVGVQVAPALAYTNLHLSVLWDTSLQRPGLSISTRRYLLDGYSFFTADSVQPWSENGHTAYVQKHEVGIDHRNDRNGTSLAVSLRRVPRQWTHAAEPDDRTELVLRISKTISGRGKAGFVSGSVAYDPTDGNVTRVLTVTGARRLGTKVSLWGDWRSGWSSRSDEYTLDGHGGTFSVRGIDVGSNGPVAHRGTLSLRYELPVPEAVRWFQQASVEAFTDVGRVEAGGSWAQSVGATTHLQLGAGNGGIEFEAGWAKGTISNFSSQWYTVIRTGL